MANLDDLQSIIRNSPQLQNLSKQELETIYSNYQNFSSEQLDEVIKTIKESDSKFQNIVSQGEENIRSSAIKLTQINESAKQYIKNKHQENVNLEYKNSQHDAKNILNKLNYL